MFDLSNQESKYIFENIKKLIKSVSSSLDIIDNKVDGVIFGKNNIQRGKSATEIKAVVQEKQNELRALNNIIVAQERGEDIHSGSLKSDKLDCTSGQYGDLAQRIVNGEDSDDK